MASFDVGDTWSPQIKITDDGVLADPATLTLKIRTPAGVITPYIYPGAPIVRDAAGVYHPDIVLTAPGTWVAQWETSSPSQVQGASILVAPAPIDVSGLRLETLKRYLDTGKNINDDLLQMELDGMLMFAAGPMATHRQLTPLADTTLKRRVRHRWIRVPDARTITAVTVDGVTVSDYDLVYDHGTIVELELPDDQPAGWSGVRWPPARRTPAIVTGTFGMTEIPDDLAVAIYKHTARAWKEREALYGDQVALEDGSVVNYFRTMPPFVRAVYESYRVASDWTAIA